VILSIITKIYFKWAPEELDEGNELELLVVLAIDEENAGNAERKVDCIIIHYIA
jgi:hypothetical protein